MGAHAGPLGGRVLQENRIPGALATPSRIHAESNGGNVHNSVVFDVGGPGYSARGESRWIVDRPREHRVGRHDRGARARSRRSRAGVGATESFGPFGLPAGSGGSARGALSKQIAAESLELRSSALPAAAPEVESTRTGPAEMPTAFVSGSNSAGSVRVFALAGSGSAFSPVGGGDAVAEAFASTSGDGHEVVVGEPLTSLGFLGAQARPRGQAGGLLPVSNRRRVMFRAAMRRAPRRASRRATRPSLSSTTRSAGMVVARTISRRPRRPVAREATRRRSRLQPEADRPPSKRVPPRAAVPAAVSFRSPAAGATAMRRPPSRDSAPWKPGRARPAAIAASGPCSRTVRSS